MRISDWSSDVCSSDLSGGGTASTVNVIIGPLDVSAGVAYRAILEDWSTGSAVDHGDVLVMTRPARQNCQFEDETLRAEQPRWMECLPQGAVPVISDIAYYCEAVRIGNYVQFQFGYDWTAEIGRASCRERVCQYV